MRRLFPIFCIQNDQQLFVLNNVLSARKLVNYLDYWADTSLHLLLLKSSMPDFELTQVSPGERLEPRASDSPLIMPSSEHLSLENSRWNTFKKIMFGATR